MCVLLYSLAKPSYSVMGKLFGRDRSLIYRWIRDAEKSGTHMIEGDNLNTRH
ncbi:MAG: helix-turn-helix domain containing protein [Candidatus Adiutrix sp.]|jgi:hypothetical protein|nr:helix-turn-helix domain containing protein [Candidatus Adiutrix sp.]